MSTRGVVLIGGPDTGKTNFVGGLWLALRRGDGVLISNGLPERIDYVEQIVDHLHHGSFAPRTDQNTNSADSRVILPLAVKGLDGAEPFELVVPDVSGEIWRNAVETSELGGNWLDQLERAEAAILFVRVLSELNLNPPDWVTAARLMEHHGEDAEEHGMPTQVMLCEFLRFLDAKLGARSAISKARVAVVVSAWDLLDGERSAAGPVAYLDSEYPLFAGRLANSAGYEVKVFGMSVLGGDVKDDVAYRNRLLASDFESTGYVVFDEGGQVRKEYDLTRPVSWAIGA